MVPWTSYTVKESAVMFTNNKYNQTNKLKKKKKHTYFYLVDIIFRIPFHIWLSLLREDSLCHSAIRTTFLFTCFPDVHKRILKIQKAVLKLMKRQKKQKTEGTPFLL